jgi:flagellar biosynthesis/type III secretory pathway protein FliH
MLGYIHTGHVGGDLATTLEEQVRHANAEEAWKEQAMGFMTLEMDALARMDVARKEGYAQGEEAGERKGRSEGVIEGRTQGISESQKRMSSLIAKLSQEGRLSDLGSVADDPDALEALMVENGF